MAAAASSYSGKCIHHYSTTTITTTHLTSRFLSPNEETLASWFLRGELDVNHSLSSPFRTLSPREWFFKRQ